MPNTHICSDVLSRLMRALDARSDAELARALGISPQSVSGAPGRGSPGLGTELRGAHGLQCPLALFRARPHASAGSG